MSFVIDEKGELPCEASKGDHRGDMLDSQGANSLVFSGDKNSVLKIIKFDKKGKRRHFFDEVGLTVRAADQGYGAANVKYGECKEDKYGFMSMNKGVPLAKLLDVSAVQRLERVEEMCPKLLKAFQLMHEDGIFHQDTHLGNLIYYADIREIRIIDYGMAIQCRQNITGTVAAAYDILSTIMQLIGIDNEIISRKQMSQLIRLLDKYWDQDSFVFVRTTVFQFARGKTNLPKTKLQPSTRTVIRFPDDGTISFIRKLFEQIPAIKPEPSELTHFLEHTLMISMYRFFTIKDIYGSSDVTMKTERRHRRESHCVIL